jgi:hypothetical protein
MEITKAPKVTTNEPAISDKIPNLGGNMVGYQSLLNKKSFIEVKFSTGNPSKNRLSIIPNRNTIVQIEAM